MCCKKTQSRWFSIELVIPQLHSSEEMEGGGGGVQEAQTLKVPAIDDGVGSSSKMLLEQPH